MALLVRWFAQLENGGFPKFDCLFWAGCKSWKLLWSQAEFSFLGGNNRSVRKPWIFPMEMWRFPVKFPFHPSIVGQTVGSPGKNKKNNPWNLQYEFDLRSHHFHSLSTYWLFHEGQVTMTESIELCSPPCTSQVVLSYVQGGKHIVIHGDGC